MSNNFKNYSQAGNVLFLILIAVALFAALSYVVTNSNRSGGSVSKEIARGEASAILNYITAIRAGITKMRISAACPENQFEFTNNVTQRNNGSAAQSVNSNATNPKCALFTQTGGGVIPLVTNNKAIDFVTPNTNPSSSKSGHGAFRTVVLTGIGTSEPDLVFGISYLKKDVCIALNDLLDVGNAGAEPPVVAMTGTMGSYTNGSFTTTAEINDPLVNGIEGFCIDAGGFYRFIITVFDR